MDLDPRHLAAIRAVLAREVPNHTVYAFGSRVSGGARPWSDLDLAAFGQEPLTLRQLRQLREAFEDSELPMRVDVSDGLRLPEALAREVRERGEVVWGFRQDCGP
jgi:type I restriction enzyme S subunit